MKRFSERDWEKVRECRAHYVPEGELCLHRCERCPHHVEIRRTDSWDHEHRCRLGITVVD